MDECFLGTVVGMLMKMPYCTVLQAVVYLFPFVPTLHLLQGTEYPVLSAVLGVWQVLRCSACLWWASPWYEAGSLLQGG